MRLLLVSKHFAPAQNPRAFRWTEVARRWAAEGHRVEVVCGRAPGRRGHEWEDGLSLHRVGMLSGGAARAALERVGGPESAALFRDGPLGWAKRGLTKGWDSVRWPDESCLWYPPALLKARALLEAERFDAFVTVSEPFGAHLVGLALKESHPTVRWLADVGDPFSLLTKVPRNNPRLFSSLNRRFERAAFTRADATAFTVEATREAYARLYPQAAERFHVVGPVVPAFADLRPAPSGPSPHGPTKLVFSGTLDRRTRNPAYLLRLFAALRETDVGRRAELHFYGNASDCAQALEAVSRVPGSAVFTHGFVQRSLAVKAAQEADILVNIGFDEVPLQLPSKAVEYTAAGKPILNISFRGDDCSTRFFEGYPALLSLRARDGAPPQEDVGRLASFVASPPPVPPGVLERWTRPYTLESVSEAYLALLKPALRR